MKQYMDVLEEILELGTWQENRTGVASIKLPYRLPGIDGQTCSIQVSDG
jgi:hypothetical protein